MGRLVFESVELEDLVDGEDYLINVDSTMWDCVWNYNEGVFVFPPTGAKFLECYTAYKLQV